MSPTEPSARLLTAARADLARVRKARERAAAQITAAQQKFVEAKALADDLDRRELALLELLGEEPPPACAPAPSGTVLTGRTLRIYAAALLMASAASTLHYRALYQQLEDRGFHASGKDPLASFLTNLRESPLVVAAGGPGIYTIDAGAEQRLHHERDGHQAAIDRRNAEGPTDHRAVRRLSRLLDEIAQAKQLARTFADTTPPATEAVISRKDTTT